MFACCVSCLCLLLGCLWVACCLGAAEVFVRLVVLGYISLRLML